MSFRAARLPRYLALIGLAAAQVIVPAAPAASRLDPRQISVKHGHPILFVDEDSVARARAKTEDLERFISTAKRNYINAGHLDIPLIRRLVDERTVGSRHEEYYVNHIGLSFGLYALLTEDPIGIEFCRQFLLSFVDMGVAWHGPGDGHSTGKLFAMGLFYDWIHEYLSDDTRRLVREHLLDSIDFLDRSREGRALLNPKVFMGSHAHYAHIYALVALLAIRHDVEEDSEDRRNQYFRLFGKVVNHWIDGYNPVAAWTNERGGHPLGWAYSQAYARSLPYLAWESATDEESWFADWQKERPFYYLYALRQQRPGKYNMFPVMGDSVSPNWNPARSGVEVAVAAALFGNPYAAWLIDQLGTSHFARLLYMPDGGLAAKPPTDLPLARHFPNSGLVIMRDSWDLARNTLMVFKSASFYSFGHNHRDENAFTIFYKGPLAIDSGVYRAGRGYGSEHWYNYYIRSVAHNTVLVYDPDEEFRGRRGAVISNDGGQRVINNFQPSLAQMTEGGAYHLDGIVKYENRPEFTYSVGDATKAYSPHKLARFHRSVIYLRNHSYDHPLMLIHDRVVSRSPDFEKTYLLHSINEPRVRDKTVELSVAALPAPLAGLYQETILPRKPLIRIIGGRKNRQEFFVRDDGFGQARNYDSDVPEFVDADDRMRRSLLEAGEWRVEISPPTPATDDTFLHALSVVDVPRDSAPAFVRYLASDNIDGVLIHDADGTDKSLVLLQRDPGDLRAHIRLPEGAGFDRVLIVGLDPAARLVIEDRGTSLSVRSDPGGRFVSSKAGTVYIGRKDIRAAPAVTPGNTGGDAEPGHSGT